MRANEFITENLRDWFKDKWVRFDPDGNPSVCHNQKHMPLVRKVEQVQQPENDEKILMPIVQVRQ